MPRPLGRSLVLLVLLAGPAAGSDDDPTYFPLRVGNWWAYAEEARDGATLSRETWTVIATEGDRGEYHLRSLTKRLDGLGRRRGRWEGHEYLRHAADGLHKRYPPGRDGSLDVLLLKAPLSAGAHWRDAQGECEVKTRGVACPGPRGELPDCAVVICRQGTPTATIITSTYARGVGMVRQEVELVQFMPSFESGAAMLPDEGSKTAHSVLRLVGYNVGR